MNPGDQLKYVYDFGDWVEHTIVLEAIDEPDLDDEGDGDTVVSERPDFEPVDDAEKETPTALLVAVGLAL